MPNERPVEQSVRPRYWMTREAEYRLKHGGNAKGAVPVHARPSVAAKIPLYGQAELDAAVAAERERCAKVCEALPIIGRTDQEALGFSNALETCAATIRGA